jgi:hypothetical protein
VCHPVLTAMFLVVALGGVFALGLLGDRMEARRPGWGLWTTLVGLASLALILGSWVWRVATCF